MTPDDTATAQRTADRDADRMLALVDAMLRELRRGGRATPARLDDTLDADLGLDSLSRVELAARIEREFGRPLPEAAVLGGRTPRELLRALGAPTGADTAIALDTVPPAAAVEGVPGAALTLVDAFAWHLERHPDRPHVTVLDGDAERETLSIAALWHAAAQTAGGLAALGVQRGERVVLMLPTSADFFPAFLGAVMAGAIAVPMYPPTRASEIEEHVRGRAAIVANSGARVLVTVDEARLVARALRGAVPGLAHVVTPQELRGGPPMPPVRARGGDVAMLQYTSGSTGDPKGVVLTHDNLLANIRAMGRVVQASSTDRFVSWLPLYHDMGLIGAWMGSAYHAIPLVVMSPASFLSRPVRWLHAIHRYRGTLSAGPNFAYEILATRIADEALEGLDLSCWRIAFNGAEPVQAATLARVAARLAPYGLSRSALTPVYGLAECAVGLTFPPPARGPRIDRIDRARLDRDAVAAPAGDAAEGLDVVSCGLPLPGHEVRIVAPDGSEAAARAEGRIEFRGPSACSGYWSNPSATRALRHGDWLDTGDVGYVADGELFVTARVKDLIKRGGHNLHPYDLEAVTGQVPGIRKGCVTVFGTPDAATGSERVVVVAETREADAAARAALVARIQALATVQLGAPADDVVLVPPRTVPKTSSGKLRRSACRALYERGTLTAKRPAVAWQLTVLAVEGIAGDVRRVVRRAGAFAWACWALAVFVVAAAVGLALLLVTPPLALRLRVMRGVARACGRAAGITLDVQGLDRLPSRGVVAVNHSSYVDAVVLAGALPAGWRFTPKRGFSTVPIMGFGMQRAGALFVERDDPARGVADTRALADALRDGARLIYFPEGTFTRAPGLQAFHLGAFAAAAAAGASVAPAVLRGTRAMLPDGRRLPRRVPLSLTILPAIAPDGSDWAAAVRLRDRVRAAMLPACGEPDLSSFAP